MTSLKSLDDVAKSSECEHIGKRVDVYYNLNKHIFSVRHKGIVILHTQHLSLKDVVFVVSEVGRQKALVRKRKNVNGVARGILVSVEEQIILESSREITYKPAQHNRFFYADTEYSGEYENVDGSKFVQCSYKKLYEPQKAQ